MAYDRALTDGVTAIVVEILRQDPTIIKKLATGVGDAKEIEKGVEMLVRAVARGYLAATK